MNLRYYAILGCLVLVALIAFVFIKLTKTKAVAHIVKYRVVDLGLLGGVGANVSGLNSKTEIVGTSDTDRAACLHAFLWSKGKMVDLNTVPGYDQSGASAINDGGVVIGTVIGNQTLTSINQGAFIYANGRMRPLSSPHAFDIAPSAINNKGEIVGSGLFGVAKSEEHSLPDNRPDPHAFLIDENGFHDLGTLGGSYSEALGINSTGDIVGEAATKSGLTHACLWRNGHILDLGTLGGDTSSASAINDAGEITGEAETKSGVSHTFLWKAGKMIDLGTLGGASSGANGINNSGQIVGYSEMRQIDLESGDPVQHAFLYDKGKLYDLNDLLANATGRMIKIGIAINNKGNIIAYDEDDSHPVLLQVQVNE